ncbi:PilZ domain-containing protein [Planomicrobium sp. CPCC 101110]|uniref:PilZ domain-containing protein n=1 Tax=Planomicrobium sp. CPCC 101110 TaxID=2599619 RepID=UPI0011B814D5|nr:PilZ domain-containing protein [Planomicrobium sp. CPCC 101110]TWT27845.1 PilZ domain-containing protein [Planomicrobium sp. CPCC 101110]
MSQNRREFFRVNFNNALEGEILIPEHEFLIVKIHDLSAKGLKFLSSFSMPLKTNLECRFKFLNSSFLVDGIIVRKGENNGENEYGVEFDIDQDTYTELFQELNHYLIRQRKSYVD